MKKYNYNEQLKIRIKPVFSSGLFLLADLLIPMLPRGINKKKVCFKKHLKGGFRFNVIRPKSRTNEVLPALVYLHGGGFGYKESFVQYKLEQEYAVQAHCAVISIDYPLLPKAVYPSAVEYIANAYEYVISHANELNIDINKIAIGGDSAGGSLATELCFAVCDRKRSSPVALMAIYPIVDGKDRPSMIKYTDVPLWNARCNKKMWRLYLNGQNYVSPIDRAFKPQIKNLFVETEEYDCLHDEGVALFKALKPKAEHAVLLDNEKTFHGYEINFKADVVQKSLKDRIVFLNKAFKNAD